MWTLVAPQVRKWQFFFNQIVQGTYYWELSEWIGLLRIGPGATWKDGIFSYRPPSWVSWSIGGHLRPRHCVCIYFLMGHGLAPQTGKPTMVQLNPTVCTLRETIGSGGAMSWGHHCPYCGERGQSAIGSGGGGSFWFLCVLVVCFVAWASLATLVVESLHQPRQNGQLLRTHTTKSAPKDLGRKCRSHTIAICRCGTRVDMLAQISFWLINKCAKRVLKFT